MLAWSAPPVGQWGIIHGSFLCRVARLVGVVWWCVDCFTTVGDAILWLRECRSVRLREWFSAVLLWGGGGGFCGEVGRYVFLSLLGRGLAGVLLLGFLAGGCACGRFCGEVRWRFWWALVGGNYACQLTVFHVESKPIFVCGALLFAWKVPALWVLSLRSSLMHLICWLVNSVLWSMNDYFMSASILLAVMMGFHSSLHHYFRVS